LKGAVLLGLFIAVMFSSLLIQTGNVAAAGQNVCFNNNGQGCATGSQQSVSSGTAFTTYDQSNRGCMSQAGGGSTYGPVSGTTWTASGTIYTCSTSSLPGYPHGFVVWLPVSPSGSASCNGCNSLAFPSSVDCGRDCAATAMFTNCGTGSNPNIVSPFLACTLLAAYNPPPASSCNPTISFGGNCGSTGINFSFLSNPITDVIIAVGVATIAGIAILGSGFSPETVRIIFLVGFFLGVYSILGVAEGSLSNAPGSLVYNLNLMAQGLGTAVFFILSLMYAVGAIMLPAPSGA
jgi:hypothetical protein